MSGMGTSPKPAAERLRRNAPTFDWVHLPAEGRADPPYPLPAVRDWKVITLDWWTTMWRTPMATQWRDDEPSVLRLALLTDLVWSEDGPTAAMLTEARQIEDRLGLSPKARMGLRWLLPDEESVATVTPLRAVETPAQKKRAALRKKLDGGSTA